MPWLRFIGSYSVKRGGKRRVDIEIVFRENGQPETRLVLRCSETGFGRIYAEAHINNQWEPVLHPPFVVRNLGIDLIGNAHGNGVVVPFVNAPADEGNYTFAPYNWHDRIWIQPRRRTTVFRYQRRNGDPIEFNKLIVYQQVQGAVAAELPAPVAENHGDYDVHFIEDHGIPIIWWQLPV